MELKLEIPPEWREELKKEIIDEIRSTLDEHEKSDGDDLMNVSQMAKWLNVSNTTIYKMINNNKDFPFIQLGGKKIVIRSVFIEWLKDKKYVKASDGYYGEHLG